MRKNWIKYGLRIGNRVNDFPFKNNYLVSLDESIISRDGDKLFAKTLLGNNEIHVDKNTIISMNMFGFTPKIFDLLEDGFNDFKSCNSGK